VISPTLVDVCRNFDEVLRILDSMPLAAKHKVAAPVNW
jgi:alkyl hydroperoxide reductase subunit AhpC